MNNKYCVNCGKIATNKHHIIPKSLGGTDRESNLVFLCDECHGKIHGIEYGNGILSHSELTKIGLQKAKLSGKRVGAQKGDKYKTKKSIQGKKDILKHSKDFNGSLSDKEVMKLTGISRNTYYKYKRELKEKTKII